MRIAVIIPCFRVRDHIIDVLRRIPDIVEGIYVVDDCCPEDSGNYIQSRIADHRVTILRHEFNQGVGGAVVSGLEAAIADGMDIGVKVDGDGQMDPSLIPLFVGPICRGEADITKGNRFYRIEDVRAMPRLRLFGNAVLSFFTKLSTGYWHIFDPTNGYVALDLRFVSQMPLSKLHKRYFFETDFLFRASLLQAKVLDIPMKAVYGSERSNLNIARAIPTFLAGHARNFFKRIFYNYFLRDFNIASLELISGLVCTVFGFSFGIAKWGAEEPATAGTVMVAALPLFVGIYLVLNFLNYDIQSMPQEPISPRLLRG